jgi:hypothetical protein
VRRFDLGRLVATPSALEVLDQQGVSPLDLLRRHAAGDWGEVCAEDARENERSVKHGWRVLSVYQVGGERLYVITEADRSSSCLLLPSEY